LFPYIYKLWQKHINEEEEKRAVFWDLEIPLTMEIVLLEVGLVVVQVVLEAGLVVVQVVLEVGLVPNATHLNHIQLLLQVILPLVGTMALLVVVVVDQENREVEKEQENIVVKYKNTFYYLNIKY
jgi:predicted metal-dependent hydrolase